MHITATREAILSATAPLMAVAQRGMKLGGTGVSLRASKNRLLQMTTCDGSAKISTLTEVSILREGAIGVSAKRLSDIVKSFHSGAQLEFDSQGESLVISSGRSRAGCQPQDHSTIAGISGSVAIASGFIANARRRSPCTSACRARVRPQLTHQ